MLSPAVAAADADSLARRIAEALCYPPSARQLHLDPDTDATYRRAGRMTGTYRDVQGPDARAWFRKSAQGATCRTPANGGLTLFFCATVTHASGTLTKERPRLCR